MKLQGQKKHRTLGWRGFLLFWVLVNVFPGDAFGQLAPIGNKNITSLERVYFVEGKNLGFTLVGKSLLKDQSKEKVSRVFLNVPQPIKKAFLIWSGETGTAAEHFSSIKFLTPDKKEHLMRADKLEAHPSVGTLYAALADVTSHISQSGEYGVKELVSDPLQRDKKNPYSVAGWALVVITEDSKNRKSNKISLFFGLQVLKPGETYDLEIIDTLPSSSGISGFLGVIGGHGRAGNGSGNLLNGLALSGQDDWNGSSGKFWDIDLFELYPDTSYIQENKGLTLTIDPLLQWLYPVGVILEAEAIE